MVGLGQAILAYTEAMDSNHDGWYDDAVLLACRSRAFLQAGIRADALKDARNAIKVNPLLPDGYMARMDAYLVLGELLKAQDDCLKALELLQKVTDTSDVHFQKLTITRNKLQDKLAVIRSAIGMETISSGGDAAMAAGAFEDAILQYTLALEHLQALEGRQQTDFASDLDSSHVVTNHRISIQMAVIYANRSAANAKFGRSRASHAVADADRALEGRPGWIKAYARRAEGLHLLGKLEAAAEDYKRAYEGDELKAYLRRNVLKGFEIKGDVFREQFAHKAAIEQYTLALDGFKSAFQEHADLHADTSMWETPPGVLLHRAEAYQDLFDPAALSDVQAVIKLAPKWAVPRVRLVEVLRTLKRGEEAYAYALQGVAELDIGSTNQAADFERVKAGALMDIRSQDTSAFRARVVKWFSRDAQIDRRTMRIFCVSDLQVDIEANLRFETLKP
jgi:tetratricopeptide (TPR) repeat protein